MKTNVNRIQKDIETLATFTSTPGNGVTRSSYSKEDKLAKEYLIKEMKKIGLEVYEDSFSTLFGRREGTLKDAPVVMVGSHYDSVVNGGAFDGVAGSVAALETMRILKEENFVNKYPIELILMNAEEGATFGPSTGVSNSRAMVGTLTEEELKTVKNRFGQTKLEAMKDYGLIPDLKKAIRKPETIKNFVELHIEQGPVLDRENIDIGLIEYLPGIGRYTIRFHGKAADSSERMRNRKDALVAASAFVVEFDKKMKTFGDDATGMVGKLEIIPNSNQFVPEYVEGKIEIRTFKKEICDKVNFHDLIQKILYSVTENYDITCDLEEITRINYPNPTSPSIMYESNVRKMESICKELGYSYRIINNGTGHDSMIMAEYTKTNMIYVPSKDGISHSPDEWTDYENIKKGADVLLQLIKDISIE